MQASIADASGLQSAVQVFKSVLKAHGLGGFFIGWRLSVALRFGSAASLVVYESARRPMAAVLGSDLANFLAGLLGRLSEVYSCHPIKTLRSRQQSGKPMLPSTSLGAIVGLWTGVGTVARADAVKIGIRFLLIERLRTILQWLLVTRHRRSEERREKNGY
mmetsp:Transcript_54162/g.104704  ORF Transcript_54162/g.104704 Transcript_54162/m.104704 type:complete len:161 (-) Transcript_54162:242-724(-)